MLGFSLGGSASAPDLTLKEGHTPDNSSSSAQAHGSMHGHGSAMDLSMLSPAPPPSVGSENNGVIVGFGGGSGGMGGYNPMAEEKRRSRMRMALEYHTNVLPAEGGVVIPAEAFPADLGEFDMAGAIKARGRDFVFAGEQLRLVVYISPQDPAAEDPTGGEDDETSPPRDPPRRLFRSGIIRGDSSDDLDIQGATADSSREGWEESASPPDGTLPPGLVKGIGGALMKSGSGHLRRSSGMKRQGLIRRSKLLLESVQRSHFFVKISVPDAPPVRRHSGSSSTGYASKRGSLDSRTTGVLERTASTRSVGQHGCAPLIIEQNDFDARQAGGLARRVANTALLPNGDVVVALQVTIGNEAPSLEASLEVLQFERSDPPLSPNVGTTPSASPALKARSPASSRAASPNLSPVAGSGYRSFSAATLSSPAAGLLQWLLPLDAPPTSPNALSGGGPIGAWASPPRPPTGAPPAPSPAVSPSTGGFTFSGGFGGGGAAHQRQPSSPPRLMGGSASSGTASSVAYSLSLGGDETDANGFRDLPLGWPSAKAAGGSGNEGLLSFRGAPLEPQRFTTQCGLEGPHVPAKRWTRQLAVLQPLSVESHVSECDTQDLLCVLVTNVLPATGMTKDVVICIDSLSMECRSSTPGTNPLPTHVASIDVGYDDDFPVSLRPGEQHSFVLRPRAPMGIPSAYNKSTPGGPSHSRMESTSAHSTSSAEPHHERRHSLTKQPEKPPNPPLHERRPSGTLSFFGGGSIGGGILGMGGGASSSAAVAKDQNSRSFGSGSSFGSAAEAPVPSTGSGVGGFGFSGWGSGGAGTASSGAMAVSTTTGERRPSTGDGSFAPPPEPIEPQLQYSIVISCRCSHSESLLHFRHPLAWRPRPSRELLLSVALEDDPASAPDKPANDALFSPQVVTVRATNLTASEVTLTLVAPSSIAAAFSQLSMLAPPLSPHRTPRLSFAQEEIMRRRSIAAARTSSGSAVSSDLVSSESLPPIHRIESLIGKSIPVVVKERVSSAADMVMDSSGQRTHLWMQSVVPLGSVPPHSTTVVRCNLLPLTDGIITLDTIHVTTKKQDMLYIPERPLQVFCDTKLAPPAFPVPV